MKEGSLLGHGWQELQSRPLLQRANVSIGVTNVTSAFRSMGKTSVDGVGNCGGKLTVDENHDA